MIKSSLIQALVRTYNSDHLLQVHSTFTKTLLLNSNLNVGILTLYLLVNFNSYWRLSALGPRQNVSSQWQVLDNDCLSTHFQPEISKLFCTKNTFLRF